MTFAWTRYESSCIIEIPRISVKTSDNTRRPIIPSTTLGVRIMRMGGLGELKIGRLTHAVCLISVNFKKLAHTSVTTYILGVSRMF